MIQTYPIRLLKALENQLPAGRIRTAEKCHSAIKTCKKAMSKLKDHFGSYPFCEKNEEIDFYKNIKPKFYSQYIYFVRVYDFMIKFPPGSVEAQQAYISSHLAGLKLFFDQNTAFYQYHRSGLNHLDEYYFTRSHFNVHSEMEDFEEDEAYSTSHDYKLSKILANESFQEFLKIELACLEEKNGNDGNPSFFPFQHPAWTGTQTDIVELVYALKASGAVNNGNIDINELINILEFVFQTNINEFYHKYIDITRRKKDVPVFINKLKDALLRQVDEKFA